MPFPEFRHSFFFRRYSQSGTPVVEVTQQYDALAQRLTLVMKQHTPDTPGQKAAEKKPFVIPVVVGLLDRETGDEVLGSQVLILNQAEQSFTFDGIKVVFDFYTDFGCPHSLSSSFLNPQSLIDPLTLSPLTVPNLKPVHPGRSTSLSPTRLFGAGKTRAGDDRRRTCFSYGL